MSKKKSTPTGDFMEVGKEVVPGMRLRAICRGHTGTIGRIAWSPCGRFIASPSADKTIRIWDANDGNCFAVLEGHDDLVNCVAWSANTRRLASGGKDRTVRIWDTSRLRNGSQSIQQTKVLGDQEAEVYCISWALNGDMFAFGDGAENLVICEGENQWSSTKVKLLGDPFSVEWSPDTNFLAAGIRIKRGKTEDVTIQLWNTKSKSVSVELAGHAHNVLCISWLPDGSKIVSGSVDRTIRIWNPKSHAQLNSLEGHTGQIHSVVVSPLGKVIASKSNDNTVRLWDISTCQEIARLHERTAGRAHFVPGLAFDRVSSALASFAEEECSLRVWDVTISDLLGIRTAKKSVRHTSAKIVLVGESNVGKSCLAMRLAEDRYPEDHEHGTTHGMRFWPMEAEELHTAAKPPEGQRRDVVLWDFGGQEEYQLVHQMFLHDTTLALVLIDPTRGRAALDQARDWNKRLEKHLKGRGAVKLLVGAKQDEASALVNQSALEELQTECGFAGYLETSAKTARNIPVFREAVAKALDWDNLAKTSRPELFQRIRDDIEARRKDGEVVLLLDDLKAAMEEAHPAIYEEAAVDAVADQVAAYGLIARTTLQGGEEVLVLQVPVIERYAGSLVMAASQQARGIAALEERRVAGKDVDLPGMKKSERLPRLKEKIVLECVVQLMIQHGLCFRHEGLYVFPSLFRTGESDPSGAFPHTVSLYYDFAGAVDNIYASLIAWLFLAKGFGSVRLWKDRAEFEMADEGTCGIRKVEKSGGFAHLDVYFEEATPKKTRALFVSFVEDHLRRSGIDVVERMAVRCGCGYELPEEVAQERYKRRDADVGCPRCDARVDLTAGAERAREHDPKLTQRTIALRTRVEKGIKKEAESVRTVFGRAREDEEKSAEPIRILHLSDLHFVEDANVRARRQSLVADIRDADDGFGFERLDYLVISGDVTHRATAGEFEKAREFVSGVIEEFDLTGRRCILTPGNHDLSWDEEIYRWQPARRVKIEELPEGAWKKEGDGYLIRDEENYPRRFRNFSDGFHHKLTHGAYPLGAEEQGIAHLFPDDRLQFLAFNSCWQIDEFFPERASLHPGAVARALEEADRQLKEQKFKVDEVLRIGVWHHPVTGRQQIDNTAFVEQLCKANVRLALHGHVHEDRTDLVGYQYGRTMHVAGAGSFGVWAEERPPSTPQLYNLIEIDRGLASIKVHTRYKDKEEGAWGGRAIWPGPDKYTKRTFYVTTGK